MSGGDFGTPGPLEAISTFSNANPGTYNFQWRMLLEGVQWFGDVTQNVAVSVSNSS